MLSVISQVFDPSRLLAPVAVGVDYAGPISSVSRQGRGCRVVKVYIAIFICFTLKAIHLELVGDFQHFYISHTKICIPKR